MLENYIDKKIKEANGVYNQVHERYIEVLKSTETFEELDLASYEERCSSRRIKMLEQLDTYQQYADDEEMSEIELAEIKRREILNLQNEIRESQEKLQNELSELNFMKDKLERLNTNSLNEKNKLEIRKTNGLVEITKDNVNQLQNKILHLNETLDLWQEYSLEDIRNILFLEIENYQQYIDEDKENVLSGSEQLINETVSDKEHLKNFIQLVKEYSNLMKKQDNLLDCSKFNNPFFGTLSFSYNDFKITDPKEELCTLENFKKQNEALLTLISEVNMQYLFNLVDFNNDKTKRIDFRFIKYFNSLCPFKEFNDFKNKYEKKYYKKSFGEYLPDKFGSVKKRVLDQEKDNLYNEYQRLLKRIFYISVNEIMNANIELPKDFANYFEQGKKEEFFKCCEQLETTRKNLIIQIENLKNRIIKIIEFQNNEIKDYENKVNATYGYLSNPLEFLRSFALNSVDSDDIIDRLVDINIYNEEKKIKEQMKLRAKIRSYSVAEQILKENIDCPMDMEKTHKIYTLKSHN